MAFSDVLPIRVDLRIVAIFVLYTIISVQSAAVPGVILREGLCESNIRWKSDRDYLVALFGHFGI